MSNRMYDRIKLGNSGGDSPGELPLLLCQQPHHIATYNLLWSWTFDKHNRCFLHVPLCESPLEWRCGRHSVFVRVCVCVLADM